MNKQSTVSNSPVYCNQCGFASAGDAQFCQKCGALLQLQGEFASAIPMSLSPPHYAGFWIRVAAALFDTILIFTALYPVRLLLGSVVTLVGLDAQISPHEMSLVRRWVRIGIGIVLAWVYRAGMESSSYQATLGKMVLRLRVTDLNMGRLSFERATGRYFAKYLSTLVLGLGYVMVAFDDEKQGLHDRIAGTRVLKASSTTSGSVHPAGPSQP